MHHDMSDKQDILTTVYYTWWANKNVPLYFCLYLCQLLTDFQNSFTGTLCEQSAIT